MHRVICLFALALCACVVAGCGGSHKKATQRVMIGAGAARLAQSVDVKAARASDPVLAIFPSAPGERKCLIPAEGGVHTVKLVFRGLCRASVLPGPPAVVVFTERWVPCVKGQECPLKMRSRMRRHSWLLTMKPLTTQANGPLVHYRKPGIAATRQRGDQPPQGPRP
jgi:hypothetical protein